MSVGLRKFLGILMNIFSIAGMILNGIGMVKIWQYKEPVTQTIQNNIELFIDMLNTSSEMLALVKDTLDTAYTELIFLEDSFLTINEFVQEADPLLTSLQDLTGKNLPNTLDSIQESLKTAQQSAEIIDTILRAISSIPFFPGEPYDPEVPLGDSLKQIGENLTSINPSLQDIQQNINSTKRNLTTLNVNITLIVATTKKTKANLKDAQELISRYQEQVEKVKTNIQKAQANAAKSVNSGVWIATFTIAWLTLAQIGLLFQGLNLLRV